MLVITVIGYSINCGSREDSYKTEDDHTRELCRLWSFYLHP